MYLSATARVKVRYRTLAKTSLFPAGCSAEDVSIGFRGFRTSIQCLRSANVGSQSRLFAYSRLTEQCVGLQLIVSVSLRCQKEL